MSPTLKAVQEFMTLNLLIKNSINREDPASLPPLFDAFSSAVTNFGACEHYLKSENETYSFYDRAMFSNRKGLEAMSAARQFLLDLSADMTSTEVDNGIKNSLTLFAQELKSLFLEIGTKNSDVAKLYKVVDESFASYGRGGQKEVYDLIVAKFDELELLRMSENRGAVENIPIWKIVAIAVWLGIAITIVVKCLILNRCSTLQALTLALGLNIAALVALFCEEIE